ncbi:helix-turn-helix domain-containing protein [Actinomadura rayongensis]|uniref:Helix-turn-helix domain-containing protein n=1 Tax=Actinomadura rayongensis TaxID=1429076 RepID=A0A6I4W7Q5_9ACTN|nr:helix-turn-helix transcriptional regulator [Actinomadura rayongensis]MXQ65323.1 helix-turn-helix domain-containing protein [Actinomadura rayongensis]
MTTFRDLMRRLMAEQGLSVREVARRAPYDPGYVSRVVNGVWGPSRSFALRVDAVLGADGRLAALGPQEPPDAASPDAWTPHDVVGEARRLADVDLAGPDRRPRPRPRALDGPDLTERLEHWISRPEPAPSAPRGTVGPDEVERIEAGARLLRRWESRHRLGVRRKAVAGQLAEVAGLLAVPQDRAVTGRLFLALAELAKVAGSMAFDAGRHPVAQEYYRLAVRAAHASGLPRGRLLGAHVLAALARQQLDRDQPGDALDIVRLAFDGAGADAPAQLRAMLRTREAWAYARTGRVQAYHRAVGLAAEQLDVASDNVPYFVRSFDRAELAGTVGAGYRGLAAVRAAAGLDHRTLTARSVHHISTALELRRPQQERNRAFDLIGLGRSYLLAGERERSVAAVREAVALCDTIRSGRAEQRLRRWRAEAAAYADAPVVAAMRADLAERSGESA